MRSTTFVIGIEMLDIRRSKIIAELYLETHTSPGLSAIAYFIGF
jgi:hypothetical protein